MAVVFDLTAESEEKGPAACDFAHVRDTRLKAACEHTNSQTQASPRWGLEGAGVGEGARGERGKWRVGRGYEPLGGGCTELHVAGTLGRHVLLGDVAPVNLI